MSLAELNEARKTAKALGIEGAHKMKLAALRDAIDAATDDERQYAPAAITHEPEVAAIIADAEDDRHFAETIAAEEDAQDTPEAAAAYETQSVRLARACSVIGTCEGCGEAITEDERDRSEFDEAGVWCPDCKVQPMSGPAGVVAHDDNLVAHIAAQEFPSEMLVFDDPHGDGTDPQDEPRADCADEACATAARERDALAADPVKTREIARTRLIAEDPHENRAVLDVRQGGGEFRHLAIPGLHVTVCMKARPTATSRTGSLNSVDCIDCLDRLVETLARA